MYVIIVKLYGDIQFVLDYGGEYPYPVKRFDSERNAAIYMKAESSTYYNIIPVDLVLRILS